MKRERTHLVCQHLEMVSRRALDSDKYQRELSTLVHRRHGLYALYRGNRLYYVGLANNLRSRLTHHLRDRHAKTWDHFSVYLTIHSDYIRELESLAIRIAAPRGNRQKGRLKHSQDLRPLLMRKITALQKRERTTLFDNRVNKDNARPQKQQHVGRKPTMSAYRVEGTKLRRWRKGKIHSAYMRKNGAIRFHGRLYTSPSLAATAVTHRPMNGWRCWKYERAPGDWIYIDELRNG